MGAAGIGSGLPLGNRAADTQGDDAVLRFLVGGTFEHDDVIALFGPR
jgi:hypothetical protein